METTVSLVKGEKVNLSKDHSSLVKASIGCGWDVNQSGGAFDLDVSVFMLNASGKLAVKEDFVFFNNLKSPCGSVIHKGDNLTGAGDGDDEVIDVDFSKVPAEVNEIIIVANIYQGEARKQNFGQVKNAFCRVFNTETGVQIFKYDLGEDFSAETAVVFGRLYRHNGEWKFEATGTGEKAGLDTYVARYKA